MLATKFNVAKKKKKKTVNLFLQRKGDTDRSNRRFGTDLGLELLFSLGSSLLH